MSYWAIQRVKEPERWLEELNRPLPGRAPSPEDLERDAANFGAFASMMGVAPPTASASEGE